jgi:hypothetical protein
VTTTSVAIRARIVDVFRRDLIGPLPGRVCPRDADLQRERLSDGENDRPSRWYLAGFLAPADDAAGMEAEENEQPELGAVEEAEIDVSESEGDGAGGAAGDQEPPEAPSTARRFLPSSIGLTVLLPPDVSEIEALVSWGDYRTEPPLPESILAGDEETKELDENGKPIRRKRPNFDWVRVPKERSIKLRIVEGRGSPTTVPESACEQRRGGGLQLETHARTFTYRRADGTDETVRAVTVFLVNRRNSAHRYYADVSYVFQARLELACERGFCARRDLSGVDAQDFDRRVADLHYRDVCDYAVGRNAAAGWETHGEQPTVVARVWTDPLPTAEVERVAPNEDPELMSKVVLGMEALADLAKQGGAVLKAGLSALPALYAQWIALEQAKISSLDAASRRATAQELIVAMQSAEARISAGITLLDANPIARDAFRLMNEAVAMAARRRNAGQNGDPAAQNAPTWRPFQIAFILLNISGLADRYNPDREIADLLFFPTGGGKTEAYLGLAAFTICWRRISGPGLLGAGVTVIMRYTLRLLTLDQLGRAAGVICALELLRQNKANQDERGRRLLGDWPIEIGLWVGSDASPNRLGKTGDNDQTTAVGRVRRYKNGQDKRAPAPLKACPWCGTPFTPNSFSCTPNERAPRNMEIRCASTACDFIGDRPLPILTVDETIYRRLPAFLIATVDKFASLPWVGETGAFFGHVDRFDAGVGFYGAAEPRLGRPFGNGWTLDPPDLIIQDELHLISGPLGTIAGLYEAAIDQLASRGTGDHRVRPKIVASTATVRRAEAQVAALFDRPKTCMFPPAGIDRTDSFFARTVPSSRDPARLYVGIAAQGRGPKLVFLRALTTLLSAAQSEFEAAERAGIRPNPADPYVTALCYFNALRELGGARRIVEDEVRDRVQRYGSQRMRLDPKNAPFANRQIAEPMELTSRESTDKVAEAKQRLDASFGGNARTVDVALATNMISVGLDIVRLGLMLVLGQPKTAAEYIQTTSRVGRDWNRPGVIFTVLNVHKPRDRMHFEQFGSFHRSFYRAVEATSVTPWASRALDRALAAIVVATIRHIDPEMTPEQAVVEMRAREALGARVRNVILARAPASAIAGGSQALSDQIDAILEDWMDTVDVQTAGGSSFRYREAKSPQRLLHQPLELGVDNLPPAHKRFLAGRSMRDVEPPVQLKVRAPKGEPIANADDLP